MAREVKSPDPSDNIFTLYIGPRKMPDTTKPPKETDTFAAQPERGETGGVSLSDTVRSREGMGDERLNEYKKGGKVKKTGGAKLHRGEFVVRKSAAKKNMKQLAKVNKMGAAGRIRSVRSW